MNNKLYFGTDGIRGKADTFPFTQQALYYLGKAIAKWAIEKYQSPNKISIPKLLIGHDTRESCAPIKQHLLQGISSLPIKMVDAGILPTPGILQLIQDCQKENFDQKFHFGIVISASHNHYTDNGIKLFDAKEGKLCSDDEKTITQYFNEFILEPTKEKSDQAINADNTKQTSKTAALYVENIVKCFPFNYLDGVTVLLDCANGATYKVAPQIFTQLGATVIPINVSPNGKNINENCGSLHPENLQSSLLEQKNKYGEKLIGFAFDGDGDRVIAINNDGEEKDGDDLLAILLQHNDFKKTEIIVGTIMTNYGFENHLQLNKKTLIRTAVGDKYVAAYLKQHNLPLGGETSGHIIIESYLQSGDGIFVALKTLESIIENKNWKMISFNKTPQLMINVPILQKKALSEEPYATIIKEHEAKLINGRIVVRYSGTENLLRVMVEDKTVQSTQNLAQSLSQKLQISLNTPSL